MPTPSSSSTRRLNRNLSNNPKEHFQSRQANFDEFKMTQENELQDTFRAVVLSSPIDENNVGTSKAGPNARITEAGFIEISVKPISDQEFERISEDGTVFYGMSPVNNPVPGDSMPSFYDLKKDDTDRFLDLVKRYHSTDDLKATSVEPVGGSVSLKFGQIVNCYYRTGNANNPFTTRGDLVFETPDNEVIHPFYTSFMQQSEVNSAKEPFANNSSRAVSVLGSIPASSDEAPLDAQDESERTNPPPVNFDYNDASVSYDIVSAYGIEEDFANKIVQVAKNLGTNPYWLANLINFETAGTFSPTIENSLGYTGLIQFGTRGRYATIKDLGITKDQLKSASAVKQMDYVEQYFQLPHKRKGSNYSTPIDLYMAVFYPPGVGRPDYKFPANVIAANNGIDTPREYARRANLSAKLPTGM